MKLPNREIGLILLAAGQSQRMGQPKQLMPLQGIPMLRRTAQTALSVCQTVVVVTGAYEEECQTSLSDLPLEIIHNPNWEQGMGSSIKAGIQHLKSFELAAVIIALADQPLLTIKTYQHLMTQFIQTHKPIIAAEYGNSLGPPALFSSTLFDRMLALPDHRGCKAFILAYPSEQVGLIDCPEALFDIDTEQDYRQVLAKLG